MQSPTTSTVDMEIPLFENSDFQDILNKRKSSAELKLINRKEVRRFYNDQNDTIDSIERAETRLRKARVEGISHAALDSESQAESTDKQSIYVKIAIWGSFLANVVLFALKLMATIRSGSLAVLASTVDSALDLLSGSIIFVTHLFMHKTDTYRYPVGKSRYENLGIIVFASLMAAASFQIIVESIKGLVSGGSTTNEANDIFALIILGIVIGTKLVLFIVCKSLASVSPSCDALADDHRNDVLTNTVAAILVAVASKTGLWWLDPAGAICLALFIIISWVRTGRYHLTLLAGKVADKNIITELTYFAANFDDRILHVDTVRAYHSGIQIIVECDVILPPEITLRDSHDIGESLQKGLETFAGVFRAYVHCDYEYDHAPLLEHKSPI